VTSHVADLMHERPPAAALEGAEAVIHLAGRSIFGRWNAAVKKDILDSRIVTVRNTVEAIAALERKPKAFICASACGYYGDAGDTTLTESSPCGTGFLADVCRQWEAEAEKVEAFGVRRISIRTGLVLGPRAGLMGQVLPLFRLCLGGRLGNGRQWMSWVHIDDIAPIYRHAALTASLYGPVNCAAPIPVTNAEFTAALAGELHRPAPFPVPRFAMRLAFNDFADEILRSQRVSARKLQESGYRFAYERVGTAIAAVIKKS
jgi:uncharacterized protein (TIGR01777 family)